MTRSDNRIKKDARARAAQTGEPYGLARQRVVDGAALPQDSDRARLEELVHLDCEGACPLQLPLAIGEVERRAVDRVAGIGGLNVDWARLDPDHIRLDSTDMIGAEIVAVPIGAGGYPLVGEEIVALLVARGRLKGHRMRGAGDLIGELPATLRSPTHVAVAVDYVLDDLCGSRLVCGFRTGELPFLGWIYACSIEGLAVYEDLRTLGAIDRDVTYGGLWEDPPAGLSEPQRRRLPRPLSDTAVGGERSHPVDAVAALVR